MLAERALGAFRPPPPFPGPRPSTLPRRDEWLPAAGGTETPFFTRAGRRLLYVYNPHRRRHAYLDLDTDLVLTDAETRDALGAFRPRPPPEPPDRIVARWLKSGRLGRVLWTNDQIRAVRRAAETIGRRDVVADLDLYLRPRAGGTRRGLDDLGSWWRSPWVWAGAGALLLLGGAGAVGVTVGFPRAFRLARNAYRTVEEWGADRGRQIREAFRIGLDRLRPLGTGQPSAVDVDDWNEQKIRTLHPSVQGRFRAFVRDAQAIARRHGRELMIWDAARPVERQVETVRRGASKTIASRHLFGLALDLVLRHPTTGGYDGPCGDCLTKRWPEWYRAEVVPMGKRHGLFWGGDWSSFSDTPHWEIPPDEWPEVARTAMAELREDFPGVA